MTCEECPYCLPCWSGALRKNRCGNCGRIILDSDPDEDIIDTETLIVVRNCEGNQGYIRRETGRVVGGCSICNPEGISQWQPSHDCYEEAAGLRFVIKESAKSGMP